MEDDEPGARRPITVKRLDGSKVTIEPGDAAAAPTHASFAPRPPSASGGGDDGGGGEEDELAAALAMSMAEEPAAAAPLAPAAGSAAGSAAEFAQLTGADQGC
jgi:hypothetical protein